MTKGSGKCDPRNGHGALFRVTGRASVRILSAEPLVCYENSLPAGLLPRMLLGTIFAQVIESTASLLYCKVVVSALARHILCCSLALDPLVN
jgi:hypothetical protein